MARGQRKKGAFDFTIWFQDGSRVGWANRPDRSKTDVEIAAAIRRYLVPLAEHIERNAALHPSPAPSEALTAAQGKDE